MREYVYIAWPTFLYVHCKEHKKIKLTVLREPNYVHEYTVKWETFRDYWTADKICIRCTMYIHTYTVYEKFVPGILYVGAITNKEMNICTFVHHSYK
jgi:hypothetical protein